MPSPLTDDPNPDDLPVASRSRRKAVEWTGLVLGTLVLALLVKTFVLQAFFIPSLSMYSTLEKGDRVLVDKVSYRLRDIHRGDLIVFERPPNMPAGTTKDLIKRVIGLPGEVIESRYGTVHVDGVAIEEGYLDEDVRTDSPPVERQTIPPGHVFVLGDNRSHSYDSRFFGPLDQDLVVGRAFVRVWPPARLDLL